MRRDLLASTPACRSRRGRPAAGPELFERLETILLGPQDRPSRAQRAVDLIRREGRYLVVSLTESRDGLFEDLACSGQPALERGGDVAVVPVLSLTGAVRGTLAVESDPHRPLTDVDRLRLEACGGVLWWLWSDHEAWRPARE